MTSASAAVYSTAFADPSAEAPTIGVITAAETAQTAALGPCTSWCERPNTAYATSAANAVYRPYCTGTPASVAYARLCGTTSAQTDRPAIASWTSEPRG